MNNPIKIRCLYLMGMPTDQAVCSVCKERKTLWGVHTYFRLRAWGEAHLREKHPELLQNEE